METFKVDLSETEGDGSFSCPQCGELISPEDKLGRTYVIMGVIAEDGLVQEATIRCNSCESPIRLEGFEMFSTVGYYDESLELDPDLEWIHDLD